MILLCMGIITLNENLSHVPTNNYLIRVYDVDTYNKTHKTLLKNGNGDVCIRSSFNGNFKLFGINYDPNLNGNNYMDLQIGISLINYDFPM